MEENLSKPSIAKLTEISELSSLPLEVKDMLLPFYNSDDSTHKRMASVLNSIFTQHNNVFLLTNSILNDLVKNDPNHDLKSCDGKACSDIKIRFIEKGKVFKVLRKPVERAPGVKGRGGLYELSHPMFANLLIKIMGEDLCEAKKDNFIKWYDEELAKESKELVRPPKTEEELKMERRAREREERRNSFN